MKFWWRRTKRTTSEPVERRARKRNKRLPQGVSPRDIPKRHGRVPPPPHSRSPWDEQTEFLPRYGDPFDG